jgi:hypothetical protein
VLERFEGTRLGRALISVVVVLAVGGILVVNMPASQLRHDLGQVAFPVVNVFGLDQNWGIFSQPRTLSAYVYADVDYADGSSSVVALPSGRGITAYVDYRWQKYEEQIRPDDGQPHWEDYARYVADQARTDGREPVRVSLVRRFADTNPPGPGPERAPWQEFTFYVLTVGPTG